jgi:hypothetical protein
VMCRNELLTRQIYSCWLGVHYLGTVFVVLSY